MNFQQPEFTNKPGLTYLKFVTEDKKDLKKLIIPIGGFSEKICVTAGKPFTKEI